MRSVTTLAVGLLLAGSAHAAPSMDPQDVCGSFYGIAETVMRVRQSGAPMPDLIGSVDGSYAQERLEAIIIMAYDEPRYDTPQYRRSAVGDFADDMYRRCLREMLTGTP